MALRTGWTFCVIIYLLGRKLHLLTSEKGYNEAEKPGSLCDIRTSQL